MSKIFALLLVLFFNQSAFSQKIKYKKDSVFVDNKSIALMRVTDGNSWTGKTYSILDLNNKEIFVIKPVKVNDVYCCDEFIFMGSKTKVEVPSLSGGDEKIAKFLYTNKLISETGFNSDAEQRFMLLYDKKLSADCKEQNAATSLLNKASTGINGAIGSLKVGKNSSSTTSEHEKATTNSAESRELVVRNRTSRIDTRADKTIIQDFKTIGYYTRDSKGMSVILTIYLPNGTAVARLTLADTFVSEGILYNFREGSNTTVKLKGSFDADKVQEAAKILVDSTDL